MAIEHPEQIPAELREHSEISEPEVTHERPKACTWLPGDAAPACDWDPACEHHGNPNILLANGVMGASGYSLPRQFPHEIGSRAIAIGPNAITDPEASVITYQGVNYYPRTSPKPGTIKPVTNDMLAKIFSSQAYFQNLLGHDYDRMDDGELIAYLKDQVLAMLDEGHEALNEMGWKPWATSRHINREAFAGELADILCFLVNLALGVGMTAHDLFLLHQEKARRNIKRQQDKYDGVTGKCPGCNRAIDDLRAKGLPVGNFGGVDYCSPECIEAKNPERFSHVETQES